ncbi:MAG: ABC transporter substrate binding protein [Planctomycetota bacterium]
MATSAQVAANDQACVAILVGPYSSYREAACVLQETLEQKGLRCVLIELPKAADEPAHAEALKRLVEARPTVIATSGANITVLALETVQKTPVVFFMVHNALDASFMAKDNPDRVRVAGVAADVSPEDWIDWIIRLVPHSKRIGVLGSVRTKRTVEAIGRAAGKRNVMLSIVDVGKDDFLQALDTLNREHPNGVLMTLDAKVYNSATVERLLVWGIREKQPVWAFSASIVRAGAFAGLYPQTEAVGRQAAELVQKVIDGTAPNKLGVQYPRQVTSAVNARTAEMIGVPLSNKAVDEKTVRFGAKP